MTDNPYEPPSFTGEGETVAPASAAGARPLGISILAVLQALGGIVIVGGTFWTVAFYSESLFRLRGAPYAMVIHASITFFFRGVLAIAAAVGMWRGRKWGWWCAGFLFISGIISNAAALTYAALTANPMKGRMSFVHSYVAPLGGHIAIYSLIVAYLFSATVMRYFRLESMNKLNALLLHTALSFAVVTIIGLLKMAVM